MLVENLPASVSQHQRQKNGEQTRNRMRARVGAGYRCLKAPVGIRKLGEEKTLLQERTANCGHPLASSDATFGTALQHLVSSQKLWISDRSENKRAVLKLIFADRLIHIWGEGFRSALTSSPFTLLSDLRVGNERMVPHRGQSWALRLLENFRLTQLTDNRLVCCLLLGGAVHIPTERFEQGADQSQQATPGREDAMMIPAAGRHSGKAWTRQCCGRSGEYPGPKRCSGLARQRLYGHAAILAC